MCFSETNDVTLPVFDIPEERVTVLLVMTKAELCSHIQSFKLNRIHIKVPFSDSIVNLIAAESGQRSSAQFLVIAYLA